MLIRIKESPIKYPGWRTEDNELLKYVTHYPAFIDDVLCWKEVPVKSRRRKIVRDTHDSSIMGHVGIRKTLDRVQKKYYWLKYEQQCRSVHQSVRNTFDY